MQFEIVGQSEDKQVQYVQIDKHIFLFDHEKLDLSPYRSIESIKRMFVVAPIIPHKALISKVQSQIDKHENQIKAIMKALY